MPPGIRSNFFTPATGYPGYPSYFGERPPDFSELGRLNQHCADVAASIQAVTEEILIGMARMVHRETGLSKMCMGVGLP